jgi:hypothetical protein
MLSTELVRVIDTRTEKMGRVKTYDEAVKQLNSLSWSTAKHKDVVYESTGRYASWIWNPEN